MRRRVVGRKKEGGINIETKKKQIKRERNITGKIKKRNIKLEIKLTL